MSDRTIGDLPAYAGSPPGRKGPSTKALFLALLHDIGVPVLVFWACMLAIYLPCLIFVYGVHNDFDQIYHKHPDYHYHEADHLYSIGRPFGALISRIPLFLLSVPADLRWTRALSLFTAAVMGWGMLQILICNLRVPRVTATALTLGIFTLPAFTYAFMQSTAWGPLLVSFGFSIWAYYWVATAHDLPLTAAITDKLMIVGSRIERRFNPEAPLRLPDPRRLPVPTGFKRLLGPRILIGTLLMQATLSNYPPNAMAFCVMAVIVLLFAPGSPGQKLFYSLRDGIFLAGNLVLYAVLMKAIYFPITQAMHWVVPQAEGSEYQFEIQKDLFAIVIRIVDSLRIGADLWFLPNYRPYTYAFLALVVLAAIASMLRPCPATTDPSHRSMFAHPIVQPFGATIVILGFAILSLSPVISAAGGAPQYRTATAFLSICMVVFLYILRVTFVNLAAWLPPAMRTEKAFAFVLAPLFAVVIVTAARNVVVTIKLCQNDYAFALDLVRRAMAANAPSIILLDVREAFMPQDVPANRDNAGRPIMPFDLSCFSSYCQPYSGGLGVAFESIGVKNHDAAVIRIVRGEMARAVSCDMFGENMDTNGRVLDAKTLRRVVIIRVKLREVTTYAGKPWSVLCEPYDMSWRDLKWRHPDAMPDGSRAIDDSPWAIFLK